MRLALCTKWVTIGGGVEIQVLELGRELARRGHQIDLFFNRDGELGPEFRSYCHSATQVPTFRFSRKRAVRDAVRLAPAVRAVVRAHPDVVYLNHADELAFGLLAGYFARSPVVVHVHGSKPTPMLPRLSSRAHRVIACSGFVRDQLVEGGVAPSKVVVVHNGIDLGAYAPATAAQRATARRELGLPEDAFVTLFFGRLDVEKGIEVLIEAWNRLAMPPERARLVIVGSPTLHPDPEARLGELHALTPSGCHWVPARRDVITPLHAADVVAVPSTWDEPFGRVVVEGLAAGLPVVASRVGGIPEILDGNLASMLFERGSAVELAERLASLVDWRKDRPELGEQCSSHAAENFGISRMADGVESVLNDAVARSCPAVRSP